MEKPVILIVEDDADIREGIRILLVGENYQVLEAATGEEALKQLSAAVDLVILDIMLPGMSGIRVCEEIRRSFHMPILFLTAKAQESDKMLGFLAGGDDYLAKPFSYSELVARVKAQLRRYCVYRGKGQEAVDEEDQVFVSGRFQVALDRNEVWKDGAEIDLTDTEYKILRLLIRHPHRIFSIQNIFEGVWEESFDYSANATVMVHIRHLRSKIEDDAQNPVYIRNVWGKGYRYEEG